MLGENFHNMTKQTVRSHFALILVIIVLTFILTPTATAYAYNYAANNNDGQQ